MVVIWSREARSPRKHLKSVLLALCAGMRRAYASREQSDREASINDAYLQRLSWSDDIAGLDTSGRREGACLGGFQDGTFGYLVPTDTAKMLRFRLSSFDPGEIEELDLSGFAGGFTDGFTDGKHGFLISVDKEGVCNVVRVDLATFEEKDVACLDLSSTGYTIEFVSGFVDQAYGYLVPNSEVRKSDEDEEGLQKLSGKVVRFDLATFSKVASMDLTEKDEDLEGFNGGFQDGTHGYLVPFEDDDLDSGSPFSGKIARFRLDTFGDERDVQTLDLAKVDKDLAGFGGGFHDSTYGYVLPFFCNGEPCGKVARFRLDKFDEESVEHLDLQVFDRDLAGFQGGFAHGPYIYLTEFENSDDGLSPSGKVVRIDAKTFRCVNVINLASADPDLKGFGHAFNDEKYGYAVPNIRSKVGRFPIASAEDGQPCMPRLDDTRTTITTTTTTTSMSTSTLTTTTTAKEHGFSGPLVALVLFVVAVVLGFGIWALRSENARFGLFGRQEAAAPPPASAAEGVELN